MLKSMSFTLGQYMAKRYFLNTVGLLGVLLAIIYLFDSVELIRRGAEKDDVGFFVLFQMAFLKLPEAAQVLFPFAVLFSAMFTFWQLNKSHELIVIRASGFSVWQFLSPLILVSIALGIFHTGLINPLGALMLSQFDKLERVYLKRERDDEIALFKDGLWLRQKGDGDGYAILHAEKISHPDWMLRGVSVLYFAQDNTFQKRLDAQTARLTPGSWVFRDVVFHDAGPKPQKLDTYKLHTNLTITDVEDSFSSPETMSFWRLSGHIKTLKETGFDAARLQVYYHHLLSQPLLFAAMVFLAATVSMRPPRFSGRAFLIGLGVFMGFVVFFFSSYLQALGASRQLPAILAAWAPALVCFLLGTTVIMNIEDG